jgi:hypothetical protein
MVTRRQFTAGVGMSLLSGCALGGASRAPALRLTGFNLVDPRTRTVSRRDLIIDEGRVRAKVPAGMVVETIEGNGRWLIPGLHDLKASLWGNDSAFEWNVLEQSMGVDSALRVQAYSGVTYVLGCQWQAIHARNGARRMELMEIPGASAGWTDELLIGAGTGDLWGRVLARKEDVAAHVARLRTEEVTLVTACFAKGVWNNRPALEADVLEALITEAARHGLRTIVFVGTWAEAVRSAAMGAAAVYGLPADRLSETQARTLSRAKVAYLPALAGTLDLGRIAAGALKLDDPLLLATVRPDVIASFADPSATFKPFADQRAYGDRVRETALVDLRTFARAGGAVMAVSDAGPQSGAFHGYSLHRTLWWMVQAGLDPWEALSAATTAAGDFLGRPVGFRDGDLADFVGLTGDPTADVNQTRALSLLILKGRVVPREPLRPDLRRKRFAKAI